MLLSDTTVKCRFWNQPMGQVLRIQRQQLTFIITTADEIVKVPIWNHNKVIQIPTLLIHSWSQRHSNAVLPPGFYVISWCLPVFCFPKGRLLCPARLSKVGRVTEKSDAYQNFNATSHRDSIDYKDQCCSGRVKGQSAVGGPLLRWT